MKPFDYQVPSDLKEAASLLEKRGEGARLLGGGTALIALMKERLATPECLIDLGHIADLRFVARVDGGLRIGAMTTLSEIERSSVVAKALPFLASVVGKVASRRLRNMITLGGCLAHGEAASDPPVACLVLDAEVKAVRKGYARRIEVKDLFVDYYQTALTPNEILTEVTIPPPPPRARFAHLKFTPRSAADKPTLGIAVRLDLSPDGKTCEEARVALSNAGPTPFRAMRCEAILRGSRLEESAFEEAAEAAAEEVRPPDDVYCSGAYKREMVKVLLPRVLRSIQMG
jgi:carbon-monoxide dehydrogenase medium subunit